MNPTELRQDLTQSNSDHMARRRAVVGLSLVGLAAMGAVVMLQTGMMKHLPDPPIDSFNSDKVNLAETAYQFFAPDGTWGSVGFAANLPLAAMGGEDRAETMPWVPLGASAKAAVDALIAAWFFYQMPAKEKAWCAYCITAAVANFGIFALTLPEAMEAQKSLTNAGM